jgi:hypothetical protein
MEAKKVHDKYNGIAATIRRLRRGRHTAAAAEARAEAKREKRRASK